MQTHPDISLMTAGNKPAADLMQLASFYKKKHYEEQHLVNSRYKLLTTRQQFYGDILTLFQSHCQMSGLTMTLK